LYCILALQDGFRLHRLERSEAIQNPSAETAWIASLRSQ
jgi:hypothetical protein